MTAEELLLQLKDIQPPPEPVWWLVAPAHIVLAGVIIGLLGVGWLLQRQRQAARLAIIAEHEFELIKSAYRRDQDRRLLALKTSRWLKQVALLAYPTRQLESLCGEAWLEFLDQGLGDGQFSRGCGRLFGGAVYRSEVDADAAEVLDLCERWLGAVKPRLQQRGRS
ncbi:MAG: DUF4381 domain-containing protein [Gammaproteobacteria bacterium]|nr:DUF4381 domain-containing protein [Gammaproteobacteria bacterium]